MAQPAASVKSACLDRSQSRPHAPHMTAEWQCGHLSRRGVGSSEIISRPQRGSGHEKERSPLGSTDTAASSCSRAKRSISSSVSGGTPCSTSAPPPGAAAAEDEEEDEDEDEEEEEVAAAAAAACDQRCTP